MKKKLLMYMIMLCMIMQVVGCDERKNNEGNKESETTPTESLVNNTETITNNNENDDIDPEIAEIQKNIWYVINEEEASVTIVRIVNDDIIELEIPSEIEGYTVKEIDGSAFTSCEKIEKVVFPEGLEKINPGTFMRCPELTSVVLPDSITSIGAGAFDKCGKLTEIVIPEGVTSIGREAFENCASLTSVIIPDSVTQLGERAFANCTNLKSVKVPADLEIPEDAFEGCKNIEVIAFSDGVTIE